MFSRADRGQEPDARRDPVVKIREVKFFVWRVDPIIGQGEPHQHGRDVDGEARGPVVDPGMYVEAEVE